MCSTLLFGKLAGEGLLCVATSVHNGRSVRRLGQGRGESRIERVALGRWIVDFDMRSLLGELDLGQHDLNMIELRELDIATYSPGPILGVELSTIAIQLCLTIMPTTKTR